MINTKSNTENASKLKISGRIKKKCENKIKNMIPLQNIDANNNINN